MTSEGCNELRDLVKKQERTNLFNYKARKKSKRNGDKRAIILSIITRYIVFVEFCEELFPQIPVSEHCSFHCCIWEKTEISISMIPVHLVPLSKVKAVRSIRGAWDNVGCKSGVSHVNIYTQEMDSSKMQVVHAKVCTGRINILDENWNQKWLCWRAPSGPTDRATVCCQHSDICQPERSLWS